MATKTNGAELKAFYNDDDYWQKPANNSPDPIWHEELILVVNGVETTDDFSVNDDLKDEDLVTIVYGTISSILDDFSVTSFESFFKAWRKKQTTVFIAVSAPREKLEAVTAAIITAGGKIRKG